MTTTEQFDIVTFIDDNPLVNMDKSYQSRLINKIKDKFNTDEQKIFIGSFYSYLNYDSKKDFVIDLQTVWKWIGFSRIDHAKRVLTKHFKEDIDYKIIIPQTCESSKVSSQVSPQVETKDNSRLNKQQILMSVNTFKKLCMKANTKKADQIQDFYLKLENVLQDISKEESEELVYQLHNKETVLKKEEFPNMIDTTLLEKFDTRKDHLVRYLRKHFKENKDFIIKKGAPNNINISGNKGNGGLNKKEYYLSDKTLELVKNSYKLRESQLGKKSLTHPIIPPIETACVSFICETFKNFKFKKQHKVLKGKYFIDLYFIDEKVAIEIDEGHHKHQTDNDIERQQIIEKKLGCVFYRIDTKNINLSTVINDLINIFYCKKSNITNLNEEETSQDEESDEEIKVEESKKVRKNPDLLPQKPCNRCKQIKGLEEYFDANDHIDGKENTCKVCVKERQKQRIEDKRKEEEIPVEKNCTSCKILLPLEKFYKDKTKFDAVGTKCKQCFLKVREDSSKDKTIISEYKCKQCNTVKSVDKFGKNAKSVTGYKYTCKECTTKKAKERYHERIKKNMEEGVDITQEEEYKIKAERSKQRNKKRLETKIMCECGVETNLLGYKRHQRTKLHLKNMENL